MHAVLLCSVWLGYIDIYGFIRSIYSYIDGLAQDCSNSNALAMELLQSWVKLYHGHWLNRKITSEYLATSEVNLKELDKWTVRNDDDVVKWKYFPRYWPFVRGIHRSPVNSPHKGQWRGALNFSLIYTWI